MMLKTSLKQPTDNAIICIMNRYSIHNRRLLEPILLKMDNVSHTGNEEQAYAILTEFLLVYQEMKADKAYTAFRSHLSYIINLMLIDNELKCGHFCNACSEIISMFAYEPVLQKRIYNNLISVLKKYVK